MTGQIVSAVAIAAFLLVPSVICWLKGKRLWATIGFVTQWHWIAVIRLAKPDSWWARRYYDAEKMHRAEARFSDKPYVAAPREVEEFDSFEIAYQDKTTQRAWRKAQRQSEREGEASRP